MKYRAAKLGREQSKRTIRRSPFSQFIRQPRVETLEQRLCLTGPGDLPPLPLPPPPPPGGSAPFAADDFFTHTAGFPFYPEAVVFGDTDADGDLDSASITITLQPQHGTAYVDPNAPPGLAFYQPVPSFGQTVAETDTFKYTIRDFAGHVSNEATVSITLTPPPPNQSPIAIDDGPHTATAGAPIFLSSVLNNDFDPDGSIDASSIAITQQPAHGAIAPDPVFGGALTYRSDNAYVGPDSFSYTVRDNQHALSNVATVTLNIMANHAPTAGDDVAFTRAGQPVNVFVLGNDFDPENVIDPGTLVITTPPVHGTAGATPFGVVIYTPAAGYTGPDNFGYTVHDFFGGLESNEATVSINVVPNQPPVAGDDSAATVEGQPVSVPVVFNDFDADTPIDYGSVTITTPPAHGTAVPTSFGFVTYTPDPGYTGPDSFGYKLRDALGGAFSNEATVTLTITPNHPPVAGDDSAAGLAGLPIFVFVSGNDVDPDGPIDFSTILITSPPAHGTAQAQYGYVMYTPDPGYVGPDSFGYTVHDFPGGLESNEAMVSINVVPNQPPVAGDDSASTVEGQPVTFPVAFNDFDKDTPLDFRTFTITTPPAHGTAVPAFFGSVTYTPDPGYTGPDSFGYKLRDVLGGAFSNEAIVTLNVTPNHPPVAGDDSAVGIAGLPTFVFVNNNDIDADGPIDFSTLAITTPPAHGTAQVESYGYVMYTPDPGYVGLDSFGYRVHDFVGGLESNEATVSLDIRAVSVDATQVVTDEGSPVAVSGTYSPGMTLSASIGSITPGYFDSWFWYDTPTDSDQSQTVTITATDANGVQYSTHFDLIVNNLNPTLSSLASDALNFSQLAFNRPVTIQGAIFDPGAADTHHALIDWGDGSQTPLAETQIDQVHHTFLSSHRYTSGGGFLITVTVYDDDGGSNANQAPFQATFATVAGAGLHDGTLEIYGTGGRDIIHVHKHGSSLIVHTALGLASHTGDDNEFDSEPEIDDEDSDRYYHNHQRLVFPAASVQAIQVLTDAGNDHVYLSRSIGLPALIDGGAGDDWLHSGGGNDQILDLIGNNRIRTCDGDDTVNTSGGDNRIWTGAGNDFVSTGGGNNEIHTGEGDDRVSASGGNNQISTDGGNDLIFAPFEGNNEIHAGEGDDFIRTGSGNCRIYADGGNDHVFAIGFAGDGDNIVFGGAGNDTIVTGQGRDQIDAGAGNDIVHAGGGNDTVQGGPGDDILVGDAGDDTINGGDGRDLIIGGTGADRLTGNGGDDILIAGFTVFDINDVALEALMTEWTSGHSYAERTGNLTSGGGLANGVRLNGDGGPLQTVFSDSDLDILAGNQGQDWFLANRIAEDGGLLDKIADKAANELWSNIDSSPLPPLPHLFG